MLARELHNHRLFYKVLSFRNQYLFRLSFTVILLSNPVFRKEKKNPKGKCWFAEDMTLGFEFWPNLITSWCNKNCTLCCWLVALFFPLFLSDLSSLLPHLDESVRSILKPEANNTRLGWKLGTVPFITPVPGKQRWRKSSYKWGFFWVLAVSQKDMRFCEQCGSTLCLKIWGIFFLTSYYQYYLYVLLFWLRP